MKMSIDLKSSKFLLLLLMVLWLPFMGVAQGFLMDSTPSDKIVIGLRFFHPNYKDTTSTKLTLLSGIYDASVSLPVGKNLNVVGSLPLLHFKGKNSSAESQSAWGNIYAGLVFKSHGTNAGNLSFAAGAYVPTLSENKVSMAAIGSWIDIMQYPRFLRSVFTINCALAYHSSSDKGLLFGVEVGGWYSTYIKKEDKPASADNSEIYAHYGLLLGYRAGNFDLTAEGMGRAHITEKYDKFRDRLNNELAFGVHLNLHQFRPGVFYKIYIEKEYKDVIRSVLGFSFDILL